MLTMEVEQNFPDLSKFCPCVICTRKEKCESECLRFKEYVGTHNVTIREKRWNNFKNLGGNPI